MVLKESIYSRTGLDPLEKVLLGSHKFDVVEIGLYFSYYIHP